MGKLACRRAGAVESDRLVSVCRMRARPTAAARPANAHAGHEMTIVDVFCGAGGLTSGFHAAGGFRTLRAVEMDPVAAASYEATFGADLVHVGPIRTWLDECDVPAADVVIGGPPCQGFSTLGRQNGEDERNLLWQDYAATIVRVRPRYFVLENVGAFVRSPQFAAFREATTPGGALADYGVDAAVLNAADYGAAQARKRTILIGHHRDLPSPGMPEPTHAHSHVTLAEALKWVRRKVETTDLPDRWTEVGNKCHSGIFTTRELHVGRTYSSTSMARIRSIPYGGNRFDIPPRLRPACWRNHTSGSMDVMGRLRLDRPSVTIRTEFYKPEKGRYLHPTEHRALTHYEAARIQGFPDTHRWVGSKSAIGRQIGNAVPIPLGRAIAEHLSI